MAPGCLRLPNVIAASGVWGGVAYPIWAHDGSGDAVFAGTGFIACDHVFVTCWHCVAKADGGVTYTIGEPPPTGAEEWSDTGDIPLGDIERDPGGSDLATASVDRPAALQFRLVPRDQVVAGTPVWTAGFPLITPVRDGNEIHWYLEARFLRGYVTKPTRDEHHGGFGAQRAYELDMPAPAGLSGSPLCRGNQAFPRLDLVGVVYGAHDAYSIAVEGAIDPETGKVTDPDIVRLMQFGLAHRVEVVGALLGTATNGRPLHELLPIAE
jgi:Trypsin-like peptidase domain